MKQGNQTAHIVPDELTNLIEKYISNSEQIKARQELENYISKNLTPPKVKDKTKEIEAEPFYIQKDKISDPTTYLEEATVLTLINYFVNDKDLKFTQITQPQATLEIKLNHNNLYEAIKGFKGDIFSLELGEQKRVFILFDALEKLQTPVSEQSKKPRKPRTLQAKDHELQRLTQELAEKNKKLAEKDKELKKMEYEIQELLDERSGVVEKKGKIDSLDKRVTAFEKSHLIPHNDDRQYHDLKKEDWAQHCHAARTLNNHHSLMTIIQNAHEGNKSYQALIDEDVPDKNIKLRIDICQIIGTYNNKPELQHQQHPSHKERLLARNLIPQEHGL